MKYLINNMIVTYIEEFKNKDNPKYTSKVYFGNMTITFMPSQLIGKEIK